jgi:hypothetical protein
MAAIEQPYPPDDRIPYVAGQIGTGGSAAQTYSPTPSRSLLAAL